MVVRNLATSTMEMLCSQDQIELLDAIDNLRLQGINHYISLPQIIVCGDQSSGKSSVLEAISGVSFPTKSSLCTRFPTELVLRKSPQANVSVSIVPHDSRDANDRELLSQFREELDSFEGLPELVERAKAAMGIYAQAHARAFSDDRLRIEVSGPDHPHLTIVDLPGLIHSETRQQSAADVELVRGIVKSYMEEPRSIILCVVSAKNDVPNQIVLKLAREADPAGARTVGVITKPDTLTPGSNNEAQFVSLARNNEVAFRLGWHVLKNMDTDQGAWTLEDRNREENTFFSTGVWATLPRSHVGIDDLRERLSDLLLDQIATELPNLLDEIKVNLADCHQNLAKLGTPRASLDEQRSYLFHSSQALQTLVRAAVDGTYNNPFFENAQEDAGYQKRIRAVVQNLNSVFMRRMSLHGHYRRASRFEDDSDEAYEEDQFAKFQIDVTEKQYISHVERLIRRTRGRELPGTFNPMVVSDLFTEQSRLWPNIASAHVQDVWKAAKVFIKDTVMEVTDLATSNALMKEIFDPAFDDILKTLQDRTTESIKHYRESHPMTYNREFVESFQESRQREISPKITRALKEFFGVQVLTRTHVSQLTSFDLVSLHNTILGLSVTEIMHTAATEALNCMAAYYKVALKRFIDGVAVDIIETTLLQALVDIFSPTVVFHMSSKLVTLIAGESKESRDLREQFSKKLDILQKGSDTCKKYARVSDFGNFKPEHTPELCSSSDIESLAGSIDG